jgi:tRNA threonylcarbamoyladenosine biosynthesis protein TsaB
MKKSLKRLVIDTATRFLYISLMEGDEEISSYYQEGHNDHSVTLMVELERILEAASLQIADIDEILVGIGPGSYTGLRVGVVVAKMFGWNNQIPVYTVSSLALMASSSTKSGFVLAEIDARRGNSFLGLYDIENGYMTLQDDEQLSNLENYKQSITQDYSIVSYGKPNIPLILRSKLHNPVEDIHGLNPNYLRITEAERNLKS